MKNPHWNSKVLPAVFGCAFALAYGALSATESTESVQPIPAEKAEKLRALRADIRQWAATCPDGSMTNSVGDCPFGDQTIFAGMSCLSGEEERCEDVRRSQSVTGEWFRSPGYVDRERENGKATFSRDQSRGVMAYLIKTRDLDAGRRWMQFIEENDWKLCKKPPGGSWDPCFTGATWWATAEVVWDSLGLSKEKPRKMKKIKHLISKLYKPLETRIQKNDYPLHLSALSVWLRREAAKAAGVPVRDPQFLDKIARIAFRRSPENAFFRYLVHGADERGADLVLKYCPATAPASVHRDWIWQRSAKDNLDGTKLNTWENPGGHDCIFMINLLIGPEKA